MSRGLYWCFTINNSDEKEVEALQDVVATQDNYCTYLCYGEEVGENGTPHLQGYLELSKRLRITGVKRLPGMQRAHLEIRRGTADQAIAYCKKDGIFVEYGQPNGISSGRRTDLERLKETIDGGSSLLEVADEHFGSFIRHERSIKSYRSLRQEPRSWKTDVKVFWGPTGTGKTRRALEICDNKAWIYSSDGWFDGYDSDANVIFDDFGGHEFKITYLLKLLDRYPMRVRIKGGFVNWVPKTIFITSNAPPSEWYPGAKQEHRAALRRRLGEIVEMDKPFYPDIDGYEE